MCQNLPTKRPLRRPGRAPVAIRCYSSRGVHSALATSAIGRETPPLVTVVPDPSTCVDGTVCCRVGTDRLGVVVIAYACLRRGAHADHRMAGPAHE